MAATPLIEIGALFVTLALAGTIADRLGQSVIPFYIVGGMLVGEHVLGRLAPLTLAVGERSLTIGQPYVAESVFVELGAELGIVFLLFFLGLEFSIDRLLASRERISTAGAIDLGINFPVGVLLGLAIGWSPIEAVLLGGIVYISSSAVITKSLIDLGWIANDESNPILGTLVFEDLFIALYLAIVSAIVVGSGSVADAAIDIGVAVGFLCVLLGGVFYGSDLFQRFLAVDSQEATVLRTVALVVFVAGLALLLDVSEAVAAFFVGMGFSSTDHVHEIEELLMPVRDLFAAVFFFWVGIGTDPSVFADPMLVAVLVLAVLVTTPTKLVSGYLGGRVYDLDERRSLRVGASMVTRGEFSLIIAATIAAAGTGTVMTETIPDLTVGYVLVMSILGTVLMQYADRLWSIAEPYLADAAE
ncbi:potassium/proton antiporter membrane subunit, CPA2 family [Natronoarchaeum philippinense]|uniref:Potassium/proton antiporter membrane subunit, CPA2 family n=1 Tax=Natronoarchaeum philippinense TaxID=558529 RepID=A0A285NZQ2_NATPI|nr:cation:proton antiporter [Natronoarchaeum philippinense]SNZ14972.1 potassium/proton antiporter membrane subunit, CPA2 family [Natronoarchaeum philippinense]